MTDENSSSEKKSTGFTLTLIEWEARKDKLKPLIDQILDKQEDPLYLFDPKDKEDLETFLIQLHQRQEKFQKKLAISDYSQQVMVSTQAEIDEIILLTAKVQTILQHNNLISARGLETTNVEADTGHVISSPIQEITLTQTKVEKTDWRDSISDTDMIMSVLFLISTGFAAYSEFYLQKTTGGVAENFRNSVMLLNEVLQNPELSYRVNSFLVANGGNLFFPLAVIAFSYFTTTRERLKNNEEKDENAEEAINLHFVSLGILLSFTSIFAEILWSPSEGVEMKWSQLDKFDLLGYSTPIIAAILYVSRIVTQWDLKRYTYVNKKIRTPYLQNKE